MFSNAFPIIPLYIFNDVVPSEQNPIKQIGFVEKSIDMLKKMIYYKNINNLNSDDLVE